MEDHPTSSSSLQQVWDKTAQKFAKVTDRLGTPIEAEIMETVMALNVLGISTSMSCGGHLDDDRGFVAPWVDIWWSDSTVIQLRQQAQAKRQQADSLHEELEYLHKTQAPQEEQDTLRQRRDECYHQLHEFRRQIRSMQCPVRDRLIHYITQFYQNRSPAATPHHESAGISYHRALLY